MRLFSRALFCLSAIVLAACNDSAPKSGTLTVQMTDAPFPFSEVASVDVFVVRVDGKMDVATDAQASAADDMSGWTTVATPNRLINLLALQNGTTTNLGATTLTTGTYSGFRLIIDPAQSSITLKDGSHPAITFPSAAKSVPLKAVSTLPASTTTSLIMSTSSAPRTFGSACSSSRRRNR